jgi:hypothetical protein
MPCGCLSSRENHALDEGELASLTEDGIPPEPHGGSSRDLSAAEVKTIILERNKRHCLSFPILLKTTPIFLDEGKIIFENPSELKERIERLANRNIKGEIPITEDTTEYMAIHGGMVLRLEGTDYFVTGDAREGRFGIND